MAKSETILIGVDTGGTFTDLVMVVGRKVFSYKTPSTPNDFSIAVLDGIDALQRRLPAGARRDFSLVHSSTVATNALLEGTGARTGLITTKGFRDVLEIGRQDRPELYNLMVRRPEPLVPRSRRLEVRERVDASGTVVVPLSRDDVERVLDRLDRAGVTSIAVCLLFSFLRPSHERAVAAAARARGMSVSASCDILPEFREYERTSTTVVNAYVAPIMKSYIQRLGVGARGRGARSVRIVQSNGGSLSARAAGERPVHTLLSGPAAGLAGALNLFAGAASPSRLRGGRFITFDMGGTSTDVSLVAGDPVTTTESTIAGHPVGVPMLDIHTVGAGGGSIARLDAGGALLVGPESAGADPGPACYGRGDRPTVTDANLVLGRLATDQFLGGRMPISGERAEASLRALATEMGGSVQDAARSVLRIVNANMERAIRVISVERGHDPRDFALVCFGGAGGLHACELAAALRLPRVVVPAHPGVLSAWGAVTSDCSRDHSRTVMLRWRPGVEGAVRRAVAPLRIKALRELTRDGVPRSNIRMKTLLDMRYVGQSYELTVPFHRSPRKSLDAFHAVHRQRYGHCSPESPVELVTIRLHSTGITPKPALPRIARSRSSAPPRNGRVRRSDLAPGAVVRGPCLITEDYSTTFLPSAWKASVDEVGHLWLEP